MNFGCNLKLHHNNKIDLLGIKLENKINIRNQDCEQGQVVHQILLNVGLDFNILKHKKIYH